MSPNEREMGTIVTRLEQIIHKQRNTTMILDSVVEDAHELKADVTRLRVMLRTALSVLAATVAGLAWVVELVIR